MSGPAGDHTDTQVCLWHGFKQGNEVFFNEIVREKVSLEIVRLRLWLGGQELDNICLDSNHTIFNVYKQWLVTSVYLICVGSSHVTLLA